MIDNRSKRNISRPPGFKNSSSGLRPNKTGSCGDLYLSFYILNIHQPGRNGLLSVGTAQFITIVKLVDYEESISDGELIAELTAFELFICTHLFHLLDAEFKTLSSYQRIDTIFFKEKTNV